MVRTRKLRCRIFRVALGVALVALGSFSVAQSANGTQPSKPVTVHVSRNYVASEISLDLKNFEPNLSVRGQTTPNPTWTVFDGIENEIASGEFEYG